MSTAIYFGAHSFTIGDKHTWKDWHLIPCNRPDFADAEPRLVYLEIPGADGELDASTALTGRVLYEMREGSFDFWVDNDRTESWYQLYTKMKRYVQGRNLKVILDDDPLWYYEGRFWFSDPEQDNYNMKVTLNYKVKPYKYRIKNSLEDVGWDDLTLDDVAQSYACDSINISGDVTLEFPAELVGRAAVVPTFIVTTDSEGLDVSFKNPELGISVDRSLTTGDTTDPSFIFSGINDDNVCTLSVQGNGTMSIRFVSGEL